MGSAQRGIRSFSLQCRLHVTPEKAWHKMVTTLTGEQDNLEETNKSYTGSHKDRRNSCELCKFIFLLFLYVFLA